MNRQTTYPEKRPFMHSHFPVLLFDGVCNFCNDTVNFLIKHDKRSLIRFTPLQSEAGQSLLNSFDYDGEQLSTLVVIADGNLYTRSDAALQLCKYLGGGWHLLRVFRLVPRPLRNAVYDWIARNRYRWFGKKETCRMPTEKERGKLWK